MADEVIAAMNRGGGRGNRGGSRRQIMDDDTSSYGGTPSRPGGYSEGRSDYGGQDSFGVGSPTYHSNSGMPISPGMGNGSQSLSPPLPPNGLRIDENTQSQWSNPSISQNPSFVAPTQNQFKRNVDVHESMILDGRTRRFSVRIPWASYCMLRPYVCASAASTETGRIVGRAQQLNADILVPTVLHTQDKSQLPRSMTPKAINVSSLPPDAFMSFLFVIRLLDGRTLRSFHRFSEVRQFTIDMAAALGTPLVEVGWFPWRNLHHSLVNVETRRAKLEAYLGMLFTHNQAMQNHPLTLSFFSRSGAADIQVGVIVPPPMKSLSSYNALQQASDNSVTARSVVSTTKRLITVVVDIDLATGLSQPLKCAKEASELLISKLKAATHGDDMSELRVISLEGVAPPAVVTSVEFALNGELGTRATPCFNDEPNLQLLRAFHHADQSGEGVLKADVLKDLLRNLGVHLPPEVTSDLLLQSYVHGETSALWNGQDSDSGSSSAVGGGGARGGQKLVDYHTFLSLVVARTQSRLIKRPGEEELLAAASMHAHINIEDPNLPSNNKSRGAPQEVAAVEVSSRAPFDWRNAGLTRFSVVLMASAHAGGAVAAAGGSGGGGGITPMQEGSPAFLDFKNKVERGFEAKVHKMKWPKAAAMVHKAVGIDPEALNSADTSNKGPSHITNSTNTNPFGEVNKPFLVVRTRLMRVTDTWTKLVWFKQGMKGAVAKVGRAFNSGMVRPSDQPGAGLFDLLQVTQVRVVENPKSALGRWFLFKADKTANGSFVGGNATVDRFFALIGLRESLYLEASSTSERDWMVAGFRQLLFGAEGRARARGFAHGRALESGMMVDPSHLSDMEGATGAAAASAIDQAMAAADASAHSFANGGSIQAAGLSFGGSSQNALRLFERFDTNGSGTLDMTEARNALRWANFVDDGPHGAEVLNRLFHRFDLDRNGTLDLREFSRLVVACEQGDE